MIVVCIDIYPTIFISQRKPYGFLGRLYPHFLEISGDYPTFTCLTSLVWQTLREAANSK